MQGAFFIGVGKILTIMLFLAVAAPRWVFCSEPGAGEGGSVPYSALKRGKEMLLKGKYSEALESLAEAEKETPFMGDYILFFKAEAYNKMSRYEDSSGNIERLIAGYPDSLLIKKARSLMVRNILQNSEKTPPEGISPGNLRYIEQYAADYPEDARTAFILGQILKGIGESGKARKVFKGVYVANTQDSEAAYRELQASDVTPEDILSKAGNYMKTAEYGRAEALLRKHISCPSCPMQKEMQKALADALFSQKKYKEAAQWYLKEGNIYNAARSFFRSEDDGAFNKALSRLVSTGDKRAGGLLIAYASRKRREGRIEDALQSYSDAGKKYPSLSEDALWGIAWTYYLNRDYRKSLNALTELAAKYQDSRYIYWKQRCLEMLADSGDKSLSQDSVGRPVAESAEGIRRTGQQRKDFYGLLSRIRDIAKLNGSNARRASLDTCHGDSGGFRAAPSADIADYARRADILAGLDMKEDAASELIVIANKTSGVEATLYISRKLQDIGDFRKSIALASRLQWGGEMTDILYPLAYWPAVSEAARQYMIDPFVLLSLIREESRFDPRASSPAGALGLMQIMPGTAYIFDKKLGMGISGREGIQDVRANIALGSFYLNQLLREFGDLPSALAAYNAGEEKVRAWLKKGNYKSPDEFIEDVPYDETRNYIKRILVSYASYIEAYPDADGAVK